MSRPKLLLVDDLPQNLQLLMDIFQNDYDLYCAASGRKALEVAATEQPDLILLDIMMPEMDGYEICAALRDNPVTAGIPVIFITARTDPESELRALAAGGADFLHKPLVLEVVQARVRLQLELAHHRHHLEKLVAVRTRDLVEARDAAESASRAKSVFFTTMSHELRTPLNVILGFTELLLEGIKEPLTPWQNKAVTTIETNSRRLLATITDILELSWIEAGQVEIEVSPGSLTELCEAAVAAITPAARDKQLTVTFNNGHAPEVVRTDHRRVQRILGYLLRNAVKFTPQGGAIGLDVVAAPDREEFGFVVWDTGIGIAPEDQVKLFQPFGQVDNSLSRRFEGTGLGLVLVKRLTDLLGGNITVTSEPGQGSRFCVTLPWRA